MSDSPSQPQITPRSIESLKRLAKALRRQHGIQHAEALDLAAQRAGFQNYAAAWSGLRRPDAINSSQARPGETGSQRQSHDETLAESRRDFSAAVDRLGTDPVRRWIDAGEIARTLNGVLSSSSTYCMLPRLGGHRFGGASQGWEPGTIALSVGRASAYVMRPAVLELHRMGAAPAESFFLMRLAELDPTDAYVGESRGYVEEKGREEVVRTRDGRYWERALWDEREEWISPEGHQPDLDDAHLVVRFLRGSLMVVATGSFWNSIQEADHALHERCNAAEIRQTIDALVARFGHRAA